MVSGAAKTLGSILSVALTACTFSYAVCPVDVVIVKGRVEHAPNNAIVLVQLFHLRDVAEDSGEVTVENGRFSIPIDFLTQSRRPVVNGFGEKCNRRPKTVIVTLLEKGQHQEYDCVSLDFAKDFKTEDLGGWYTLRSELVLEDSR